MNDQFIQGVIFDWDRIVQKQTGEIA